jgi:hypothetical protein
LNRSTRSAKFPENPDNELACFDAFQPFTNGIQHALVIAHSSRNLLSGGKAMPMTFKIERLVRGEHFNAQASRFYRMGLTLITAHFVDRLANDARFNLVRYFALLRKGIVMEEVNSQRQQDEFLANVKFITPTPTDEVLVAAAKLGDHPAFVELWTRHSSRAFKTIYRITGNRDDAEDAIQDAWMKAYLHLNTFDGRQNSRLGSRASRSIRR